MYKKRKTASSARELADLVFGIMRLLLVGKVDTTFAFGAKTFFILSFDLAIAVGTDTNDERVLH